MTKELSHAPEPPVSGDAPGSQFTARDLLRLAKKQAVICCLNLVRNWQVDGMPSSDNGISPDADEVWKVVEWLQKRLKRYSANDKALPTPAATSTPD